MSEEAVGKLTVNLIGCPCSGKTVAATSLFSKLKRKHMDVVLVSEFATDKVIEHNHTALADQLYIFSNQNYKIFCASRHAKIVVTDSPILLASVYNDSPAVRQVILEHHQRYNNFNIFLELDPAHPYSMTGRVHSMTESVSIQNQLYRLMDVQDIPYVRYNEFTEDELVQLIMDAVE